MKVHVFCLFQYRFFTYVEWQQQQQQVWAKRAPHLIYVSASVEVWANFSSSERPFVRREGIGVVMEMGNGRADRRGKVSRCCLQAEDYLVSRLKSCPQSGAYGHGSHERGTKLNMSTITHIKYTHQRSNRRSPFGRKASVHVGEN